MNWQKSKKLEKWMKKYEKIVNFTVSFNLMRKQTIIFYFQLKKPTFRIKNFRFNCKLIDCTFTKNSNFLSRAEKYVRFY